MTSPQQERSWRSRARVLEAARSLLVEQGPEAVVLADVARLAGVAVGTIYTRFSDKTALLREVHREEAGEMHRRSQTALQALAAESASADDVVDGAVRAVASVFFEHAGVMRQLFILAGHDVVIREQGAELVAPIAAAFRGLLTRSGAATGPDPEFTAEMCFEVVFAACAQRIMLGAAAPHPRELTDEQFVAELVRMARGYLAQS